KFNLIEDHGLRGDEPDRETNHKGPERELRATSKRCNRTSRQIAPRENAIAHGAMLFAAVRRFIGWVRQRAGFEVASILVRFHAETFAPAPARRYLALARFSAATPEVIHNPSFEIRP